MQHGGVEVTSLNQSRTNAFLHRFPDRVPLPTNELYGLFFPTMDGSREDFEEIVILVSQELAVPVGLLRPEDQMSQLLEPLHGRNPLRWIEEWTRAADGKSELNVRRRARLESLGTVDSWHDLPALRDVVRAWCGLTPDR